MKLEATGLYSRQVVIVLRISVRRHMLLRHRLDAAKRAHTFGWGLGIDLWVDASSLGER